MERKRISVICHLWRPQHQYSVIFHNDVVKWKHFPRYWPFVRWIHWSPGNSSHKGQWRGALMFSLFCAWTNGWVHNRDAGDLRHNHAHYNVTVMSSFPLFTFYSCLPKNIRWWFHISGVSLVYFVLTVSWNKGIFQVNAAETIFIYKIR